ncbi:MAG: hypothetical protein JNN23_14260 [Chryseobacterium gambrini]|nr:hypothetical protein [Chryseobacterium gambrini]
MKKNILTLTVFILMLGSFNMVFGQRGINTATPSAALDIVAKGDATSPKGVLKVKNSSATEMVTVINEGTVGINQPSPSPDALLELNSTTKALLITRVDNTAAIANPVDGMILYDKSVNCFKSYENNAWSPCLSK